MTKIELDAFRTTAAKGREGDGVPRVSLQALEKARFGKGNERK